MPPRSWTLRIEDMLDGIEKIGRYTAGMNLETFGANDLVLDAVVRNLSVIGEAARHVPDEVIERYSAVPWLEMRGMRNIIVHEYFGADLKTIWDTVQFAPATVDTHAQTNPCGERLAGGAIVDRHAEDAGYLQSHEAQP